MSRTPTRRRTLQNPDALRRMREKDGLNGVGLARKAGITSQHLSRLESGVSSASPDVLRKLASALAVEISAITRAPCECETTTSGAA